MDKFSLVHKILPELVYRHNLGKLRAVNLRKLQIKS